MSVTDSYLMNLNDFLFFFHRHLLHQVFIYHRETCACSQWRLIDWGSHRTARSAKKIYINIFWFCISIFSATLPRDWANRRVREHAHAYISTRGWYLFFRGTCGYMHIVTPGCHNCFTAAVFSVRLKWSERALAEFIIPAFCICSSTWKMGPLSVQGLQVNRSLPMWKTSHYHCLFMRAFPSLLHGLGGEKKKMAAFAEIDLTGEEKDLQQKGRLTWGARGIRGRSQGHRKMWLPLCQSRDRRSLCSESPHL